MQNSLLLQSLKQQVLPKVVEVTEVTNPVYKSMLEVRNTTIKQKQNDWSNNEFCIIKPPLSYVYRYYMQRNAC